MIAHDSYYWFSSITLSQYMHFHQEIGTDLTLVTIQVGYELFDLEG